MIRYKFIVDAMLGKLARFLRLLGYDTIYNVSPPPKRSAWCGVKLDDAELVKIAKTQRRILVTRDTHLIEEKARGIKFYLIKTTVVDSQLKQISQDLSLKPVSLFSRCLECNSRLKKLAKQKAKKLVPKFVFEAQDAFCYCPHCRKVYWRGSHTDKMLNKVRKYCYSE